MFFRTFCKVLAPMSSPQHAHGKFEDQLALLHRGASPFSPSNRTNTGRGIWLRLTMKPVDAADFNFNVLHSISGAAR